MYGKLKVYEGLSASLQGKYMVSQTLGNNPESFKFEYRGHLLKQSLIKWVECIINTEADNIADQRSIIIYP